MTERHLATARKDAGKRFETDKEDRARVVEVSMVFLAYGFEVTLFQTQRVDMREPFFARQRPNRGRRIALAFRRRIEIG